MTDTLPKEEFSEQFVEGMRDRVAISFHKYGPIADAVSHGADFMAALNKRLALYEQTGNTEWLMDVANYAMFEFIYPAHPHARFRSTGADESPGKAPERKRRRG